MKKHDDKCECIFCKCNIPFDFPEHLYRELVNNNVVLFAGSGISTENKLVFPYTFYDDVKMDLEECDISINDNMKFNLLMDMYVEKFDKVSLINKVIERFDYINSYSELNNRATMFHSELASISIINKIITTNWDDYFEICCNAKPIVENIDLRVWAMKRRTVLKIHGSINSLNTMVLTTKDYDECYNKLQSDAIGIRLQEILCSKCLLFVGYSLNDYDFNRIYSYIKEIMNINMPKVYIIDLYAERSPINNAIVINTDGSYFLQELKKKLIDDKLMLNVDKIISMINMYRLKAIEIHHKTCDLLKKSKYYYIAYTCSYQDGLIHSMERFMNCYKDGSYSDERSISSVLLYYKKLRNEKKSIKKYDDVAYIDGYVNGIKSFLSSESFGKEMTPFYIYDLDDNIGDYESYVAKLFNMPYNNELYEYANKYMLNYDDDIDVHHTPFLL